MRCTNRIFCLVTAAALLFSAGCTRTHNVALSQPYDVYQTTANAGISGLLSQADNKTYFADNLCVSEDIALGTDTTNSQVAEGAGTFNLATNSVVYAKNIYKKLYPASTTKIMTAYLVLKYAEDLDAYVTVSEHAANQASDSSVCGLRAGDVIRLRDLLYGLMLRSGNDAAIAIAEHMSGDETSFAELMNQEAKALGATQTHFVNASGLPDLDHYTSVYDLYLIFNAAIQNSDFVNLISTKSYDVVYTNAAGDAVEHTWENTNCYLNGHAKTPEGFNVIGGKTGTTGDAGYCLVLYSFNSSNQPIISIVLKADGKSNLYLLMNEMLQGFAN